jgi:hypothetical protein
MLIDYLVEDFANLEPHDFLPKDYNIWYVGTTNSIEKALYNLLANLKQYGHIIVGEMEIADYVYGEELIYVILYRSLPNLEYLEYKYQEKEDNNA